MKTYQNQQPSILCDFTVVACWYFQMGFDKVAITTALQALVSCCHFIVDEILVSVRRMPCLVLYLLHFIYCYFHCNFLLHTQVYTWLRSKPNDAAKYVGGSVGDDSSNSTGSHHKHGPYSHHCHHGKNREKEISQLYLENNRLNEARLRLRRLVHQSISDILDPSR